MHHANDRLNGHQLSARQAAILEFVRAYLPQHGRPPAIREIALGVGIASNSCVLYHINRLIERGYMAKQPGGNRTLVVLETAASERTEPSDQDLHEQLAVLKRENRRLREWCRQLERERVWEREQRNLAQAG